MSSLVLISLVSVTQFLKYVDAPGHGWQRTWSENDGNMHCVGTSLCGSAGGRPWHLGKEWDSSPPGPWWTWCWDAGCWDDPGTLVSAGGHVARWGKCHPHSEARCLGGDLLCRVRCSWRLPWTCQLGPGIEEIPWRSRVTVGRTHPPSKTGRRYAG